MMEDKIINNEIQPEEVQETPQKAPKTPNRLLAPAGYAVEANVWDRIYAVMRQEYTIVGNVSSIINIDGTPTWEVMIPEFPNQKGLVPVTESGLDENVFYKFVGQDVYMRIQACDPENDLFACSCVSAVNAVKDAVLSRLAIGKRITIIVKAIVGQPARLIADIGGGVLVEIPAKDARRYYSRYLSEQYQPGQQVEAEVISLDPLKISIKTTYPDPWQTYSFTRGQIVVGTIIRVFDEYMTIETDIAPGMIGTAPVPITGSFFAGDRVQCSVTRFLREDRKFNLRVRNRVK